MMRKVEVSRRVRREVDGRVHWEFEAIDTARFHQFGVDYEEFENGVGNYTTAVIEWPDGRVESVPADHVRFLPDAVEEPTQPELDAFLLRAGFPHGWENLESSARKMVRHAVTELNRKGRT